MRNGEEKQGREVVESIFPDAVDFIFFFLRPELDTVFVRFKWFFLYLAHILRKNGYENKWEILFEYTTLLNELTFQSEINFQTK